jgi:hypothetical protein
MSRDLEMPFQMWCVDQTVINASTRRHKFRIKIKETLATSFLCRCNAVLQPVMRPQHANASFRR